MSRTQAHAVTFFRAADPFEIPSLNAVRAESSVPAATAFTILGLAIAAGAAPNMWCVWAAVVIAIWLGVFVYRTRTNPLREPILRLNSTSPRPGQDLFVGCIVTPKSEVTIQRIELGFETEERRGEDSRTETYPAWECSRECFLSAPVPLTVAGTLAVPELREREWKRSKRTCYVTLAIVPLRGLTVRRRYRIQVLGTCQTV